MEKITNDLRYFLEKHAHPTTKAHMELWRLLDAIDDKHNAELEAANKQVMMLASELRKEASSNLKVFEVLEEMLDYRKRNTLSFQLEKLDDYLRRIEAYMDEEDEA